MEYVTELDRLGMQALAKERAGNLFWVWRPLALAANITVSLESLDDLFKKDEERTKDGFPKRIKFRRVIAGPGKVVNVPYVEEECLIHAEFEPKRIKTQIAQFPDEGDDDEIGETTGHGEGEVGDVIGERPIGGGDDGDDGDGDGKRGAGQRPGDHGFLEEIYEAGKKLIEKLQLPNLKEKLKKVPTDEYTYDLTDRHKGSGQLLDKKETLKQIVKTNLILGRVSKEDLDPAKMIIGPGDRVYRVLSREKIWKSQAIACFLRDYSGSMWGEPTKSLLDQHLMIYAWLLVQYEKRVIVRFFVHDTDAKEVTAKQYFTLQSGGGTFIASGYKKINEVIECEALERDYNIYVFQGTDGDDYEYEGKQALPELKKILQYANRTGVTVFKHPYHIEKKYKTTFEEYIEKSKILERKDVFRMHVMPSFNVTEEMNIEALKALIAQD